MAKTKRGYMILLFTIFVICLVFGIIISLNNIEACKGKQIIHASKPQEKTAKQDHYSFGTINTSTSIRSQKLKQAYLKQQADNLKKPFQPSIYKTPEYTSAYENKEVKVDTSYTDWLVTAAVIDVVTTDCSCHDGGYC